MLFYAQNLVNKVGLKQKDLCILRNAVFFSIGINTFRAMHTISNIFHGFTLTYPLANAFQRLEKNKIPNLSYFAINTYYIVLLAVKS